MKKKQLFLIGYAFFMILCSKSLLWGQPVVFFPDKQDVPEITPRRVSRPNHRDTIGGPGNVGGTGEFGAGESAAVNAGRITWPAAGNHVSGSILIGSDYSKNAVVGIYDNDGQAAGKLRGIRLYGDREQDSVHKIIDYAGNFLYADGTPGSKVKDIYALDTVISAADAVPDTLTADAYKIGASEKLVTTVSGSNITGSAVMQTVNTNRKTDGTGTQVGGVLKPYFNPALGKYVVPIWNHISMDNKDKWNAAVVKQDKFTFDVEMVDTLYTSTRDVFGQKDDGKSLLYSIPGFPTSRDDFLAQLKQSKVEYVRPTTVLLSGTNNLNDITIGNVEWYATYFSSKVIKTDTVIFFAYDPKGCAHLSGWASYIRDSVRFDTVAHAPSTRLVDAAVRLLDGTDVCVNGSVSDKTSKPYSLNTPYDNTYGLTGLANTTDAILVLPGANDYKGERSNFRLKIGGDANMLHTQDSGYYLAPDPFEYGYLYCDADSGTGPGAKFPTAQTDIFLSGGTNTYTEVARLDWSYLHPREAGTLTAAGRMPYTTTTASVYGVKGAYNGGTGIHTRSVDRNDTTGIIEIGSGTNNQNHFKIYSSGMLKNFRSIYTSVCDSLVLGGASGTPAPGFYLSNNDDPLYIINDGDGSANYCCAAGIRFNKTAIDSINKAVANATGSGDLHIQAHSFVKFYGADLNLTHFASVTTPKENEIKILSDHNAIYMEKGLNFEKADTAHLTVWAKGPADANRGYSDLLCTTGAVRMDGNVTAKYEAAKNGKGLILLRSDHDDVLIGGKFEFENRAGKTESGELIVQAGQDVRIDGATTLTHDGQRSMLFEAQKTATFGGPFTATTGGAMRNGDLTIKAGYPGFLPTADVQSPLNWGGTSTCVTGSYANREANQAVNTGGDIWFKDAVAITLAPAMADSVDTYIRAFNSIYIDGNFKHTLTSTYTPGGDQVDTTMLFAETGNIEAIHAKSSDVAFNISSNDSVYLLLQAGNKLGDPCGATLCSVDDQWHGNILLGKNKTLTITHEGVGPTLISASRDIENRTGANVTFTYTKQKLGNKDNLLITAGRHIETHAPYLFDYSGAGSAIESRITLRAGHADCNYSSCKTTETASNVSYNDASGNDNAFASGGAGRGSILLFDSVTFNYAGMDTILLTAKNGNIESDPYLHGNYGDHNATLTFNHAGTGITRLEAIDIKLHDLLVYNGQTATDLKNGRFYMAAYDSILTRSLYYKNPTDTGSVYITTDKLKRDAGGNVLPCSVGGIHQGHIVLGYGADDTNTNRNDTITFDFSGNGNTTGANVYIRAGYDGFTDNPVTGSQAHGGKGYGGNITFDFVRANMAKGNHAAGGYMEISTPNGNIWGKDSMNYNAHEGDLLVDAGAGSMEDTLRAVRWSGFSKYENGNGPENTLNTNVALNCGSGSQWRTGNIMMKGATLDFNNGSGNAIFRTREGFIDTYDAFTVQNMVGHLLKYAGADDTTVAAGNHWGDVSERDFRYTPGVNSGSVFFGADDNIMLNYGYSNAHETAYGGRGKYDIAAVTNAANPYYSTAYMPNIGSRSVFDVNKNGYLWYRHDPWKRTRHILYRGCEDGGVCSPITGLCKTSDNHARDFVLDFRQSNSGGFASVARNYIDVFTKFVYYGGSGSGLHTVPGMGNLRGEDVQHYGLYMKSQFDGTASPEKRRATCEDCGVSVRYPIQGRTSAPTNEWTYIGFHDDARIHTQNQKSLIEAPVIEFFGHAELNSHAGKGAHTKLTLKSDSLIFHDSVVFNGTETELLPYTTGAQRQNDMRYGVINDDGDESKFYNYYGRAITMPDRNTPVLELGYQRCTEPLQAGHAAPNSRSQSGRESTPTVGGDVIVAFKHDFSLPIFNSVVADHARISFISDRIDHVQGGEFVDAFIRTDLLRIRNKVEFYTDPSCPADRRGTLKMTTENQIPSVKDAGMYPRHLHLEPGSELSLSDENSLMVISTTTLGGYGHLHENVFVKANGILAPGYASLMESDCQTGEGQGEMRVHNLTMESGSILRVSLGRNNRCYDDNGVFIGECTRTDVLVADSVFTSGDVYLYILPVTEHIDEGCYLIFEYGDTSDGLSHEYVKNIKLAENRFGDLFFTLDYSIPGKVYLCATEFPIPIIQRYIELPAVEGVTTTPGQGKHYVQGHKDFTFTATFSGVPLKVRAKGVYSGYERLLDQDLKILGENSYEYRIRRVVEPWIVSIGPDLNTDVGNENADSRRVWSYRNTLYINTETDELVSIYNMTGVLYKKIAVPAGLQKFPMERGIYIVTLNDGSAHKIVIN